MSAPRQLELVRVLDAPIARVYAACTRPEQLARWLVCAADGGATARCDLRVGGSYRVEMSKGGVPIGSAHGIYLEIEPERRLVFTWSSPNVGVEDSRVTIELRALRVDRTELRLVHDLDPSSEAGSRHERGWTVALALLQRVLDELA